ncbi:DUF6731 family protein [Streptomonospora alba]|uniref:DUF6731 family protein n=1 Tax=Streptomonospora alba TaxID=183763 RepID=UPI001930F5CE|nr:DUF6731 family protein [Streptomonospora alba]
MAQKNTYRERTVSFYEIVFRKNGEEVRGEQVNWKEFLSEATRAKVAELTLDADETFVGSIVPVDEEDHLLLHRVKGQTEWLSVMNWETGEWKELESKASEGYLDTSVISFLSYGNIVGIMQGATSSPTHKSLEKWINGIKVFERTNVVVRPLVSQAQVDSLRQASGANRIEIRIGASKSEALSKKNGRLANMLKKAREDYGDISVTLIISVPRGKSRTEDRQRLLNDLQDLEEVMPKAAEKAKATLVYAEEGSPEQRRLVELVEHHITAKRRVPAVDEDGNSVRILSAVGAILEVADQHEAELRRAADVEAG